MPMDAGDYEDMDNCDWCPKCGWLNSNCQCDVLKAVSKNYLIQLKGTCVYVAANYSFLSRKDQCMIFNSYQDAENYKKKFCEHDFTPEEELEVVEY